MKTRKVIGDNNFHTKTLKAQTIFTRSGMTWMNLLFLVQYLVPYLWTQFIGKEMVAASSTEIFTMHMEHFINAVHLEAFWQEMIIREDPLSWLEVSSSEVRNSELFGREITVLFLKSFKVQSICYYSWEWVDILLEGQTYLDFSVNQQRNFLSSFTNLEVSIHFLEHIQMLTFPIEILGNKHNAFKISSALRLTKDTISFITFTQLFTSCHSVARH